MGYHRAGFDVVGVDHLPQPRYPFRWIEMDALEYCRKYGHEYDVIHASPPCQRYSVGTKRWIGRGDEHVDLVPATRELLEATGKTWVIENVFGSPLRRGSCLLCGSMFDMCIRKHRYFECNHLLFSPGPCRHAAQRTMAFSTHRSTNNPRGKRSNVVMVNGKGGRRGTAALWQRAMGIDWMTVEGMAQAIPPAYTEYVGKQLMRVFEALEER